MKNQYNAAFWITQNNPKNGSVKKLNYFTQCALNPKNAYSERQQAFHPSIHLLNISHIYIFLRTQGELSQLYTKLAGLATTQPQPLGLHSKAIITADAQTHKRTQTQFNMIRAGKVEKLHTTTLKELRSEWTPFWTNVVNEKGFIWSHLSWWTWPWFHLFNQLSHL